MGSRFVASTAFNISLSLGQSCSVVSRQLPLRSAVKQKRQTSETTGIANCVLAIMNDTGFSAAISPKRDQGSTPVRDLTPSA